MIGNTDIQSAWTAKLKATPTITALVPAVEIREHQWKGTNFTYPNIRVKLTNLSPQVPNNNCLIFRSEVTILCFSEQKSSKLAEDIAGAVVTAFWGHPFSGSGVKFTAINWTNTVPPYTPEYDDNARKTTGSSAAPMSGITSPCSSTRRWPCVLPQDSYPTDKPTTLINVKRESGYLVHPRAPEELLAIKWFAFRKGANGDYQNIPWPEEVTPVLDTSQGTVPVADLIKPASQVPEAEQRDYLWIADKELARAWLKLHSLYYKPEQVLP